MKDLINVLIVIPILALAWIGYHRAFPEGFNAQEIPSVIQSALPDNSQKEQKATNSESEAKVEPGTNSKKNEGEMDQRIAGPGYTNQQLLADATPQAMEGFKTTVGQSGASTETKKDFEVQSLDRLDQAISLMDRLNKLGGK